MQVQAVHLIDTKMAFTGMISPGLVQQQKTIYSLKMRGITNQILSDVDEKGVCFWDKNLGK